jgi:dolichyl-phosphate-mannose-protein mannosyltransferase
MVESRKWLIVLLLMLSAFALRFYNLGYVEEFLSDEPMHVPGAIHFSEEGYFIPDTWHHPPLKHLLLYASIRVFGDNPYGWRMRNVLFGTITIGILFLLTLRITKNTAISIFSSVLLLLDPLHMLLSRLTFEDIPAICFMLSGIIFFLRYMENLRHSDLFLTGLFLGLSTACKLYGAFVLILLLLITLFVSHKDKSRLLECPVYLGILPLTVYILSYYPWFQRGYSFLEWIEMQFDAMREMATATGFHPALMHIAGPEKWFIKPMGLCFYSVEGRHIFMMNNIVVWILVIPSVIYTAISGLKLKDRRLLLVPLLFITLYIPFLIVERPILLYSASVLLPFAFIAISYTLERAFKKTGRVILLCLVIESLLLYPFTTAIKLKIGECPQFLEVVGGFAKLGVEDKGLLKVPVGKVEVAFFSIGNAPVVVRSGKLGLEPNGL